MKIPKAPYNHNKVYYKTIDHDRRYIAYAANRPKPLVCQECKGAGGWTDYIDYWIGGPFETCGWCCGGGFVTPHDRGLWLRLKKAKK